MPPEGTFLAGVHYELNEEFCLAQRNLCIFPDTVQTAKFHHQWILKPRDRPVDPCPQGTPLPKKGMAPEENARLCSVYMRPWTLIDEFATAAVPHLRNLNVVQQTQARLRRRLRSKTSVDPSYEYYEVRSWRQSWRQFIDGHIVSDYSARIIKNFLLLVAVESHRHDDADDEVKELSSAEVPLHSTSLEQIHEVLDSAAARVESDVTGLFFSQKMQAAMKR